MIREYLAFGIVSGSMRPVVNPGETVLVVPCPPAELRPGDLVVVRRPGGPVCHRFLRRAAGLLVTQGDNTWRADAPVPENALVGRVVSILAPGGRNRPAPRGTSRLAGLARILGRRLKWTADALLSGRDRPAR